MPLKYLSPLLLAGSATAFEFYGLGLKALAANNAVNAAASTDAGYKACNSVSSVVMSCSAAGSIAESVPEASQAACVCCQGNSELDPVYSNCAAYVSTALQNPSLASGMTNPSLPPHGPAEKEKVLYPNTFFSQYTEPYTPSAPATSAELQPRHQQLSRHLLRLLPPAPPLPPPP